ncbi:hypothetical protein [Algoriphagus sp.]|uniref:hypothetical protein n=1 Tax=Algoriphagus sp. TaxID=1872435 RepID=UPI003F6EDFAA
MNKFTRYITLTLSSLFTFLLMPLSVYSQKQPGIPRPTGPIDFSQTSNQIIFVLIPAIIIIAYLIFRGKIKKVKQEKKDRLKKKDE